MADPNLLNSATGAPQPSQTAPQSAPTVAPGGGGVSSTGAAAPTAAPVGIPDAAPPSFATQLHQAVGTQPGSQTNMLGQPTGAAPVAAPPATPATFESLIQANPHLAEQYAAMMQYAMAGQQAVYQQRQAASQPAPAAQATGVQRNAFGVPQFDKSLLRFLTQDPTSGEVRAAWGAPPGILHEYHQYREAREQAIEKLLDDPKSLLMPLLKEAISEHGGAQIDNRIQTVQERAYANNYVDQNRQWLFENKDGQVAKDVYGRPQLSALGKLFKEKCERLQTLGVKDPVAMQQEAEAYVFGVYAAHQLQAQRTAQTQSEAGKQGLLNSQPTFTPPSSQGQFVPQQTFVAPQGDATTNVRANLVNAMVSAAKANGIDLSTPA